MEALLIISCIFIVFIVISLFLPKSEDIEYTLYQKKLAFLEKYVRKTTGNYISLTAYDSYNVNVIKYSLFKTYYSTQKVSTKEIYDKYYKYKN